MSVNCNDVTVAVNGQRAALIAPALAAEFVGPSLSFSSSLSFSLSFAKWERKQSKLVCGLEKSRRFARIKGKSLRSRDGRAGGYTLCNRYWRAAGRPASRGPSGAKDRQLGFPIHRRAANKLAARERHRLAAAASASASAG